MPGIFFSKYSTGASFKDYAEYMTSNSNRIVDISIPGWQQRIKDKMSGTPSGKFDRIIIADHGFDGGQNWIDDLDFMDAPGAFSAINAALKDGGALILAGCNVANNILGDGPAYLNKISKAFGPRKNVRVVGYTGPFWHSQKRVEAEQKTSTYWNQLK